MTRRRNLQSGKAKSKQICLEKGFLRLVPRERPSLTACDSDSCRLPATLTSKRQEWYP